MACQEDVRHIALSLPHAVQEEGGFSFAVGQGGKKPKGFAWVWQERITPKKPRVPNNDVIALRVADETEKRMLLDADAEKFFTEPHYNGFPAILVRLPAIGVDELAELITDAWHCQAPPTLIDDFNTQREPGLSSDISN